MKKLLSYILIIAITFIASNCKKDSSSKDNNNNNDLNTIKDIDGNIYHYVTIGTFVIMKENLKTTKLNDKTPISNVTGNTEWYQLSTPGYCWYNNDAVTYKNTYGALYNSYAVKTGKLCPEGWRVPSDSQWDDLIYDLGDEDVAGGKMKEIGLTHWQTPNTGADNSSGFSGLPGGKRDGLNSGDFKYIGTLGIWWASTSWSYSLHNDDIKTHLGDPWNEDGLSVRCIKN